MKDQSYYIFNNGRVMLYLNRVPTVLPGEVLCENLRHFVDTEGKSCIMGCSIQENLPEGYVWMDLRESFYVLTEAQYRMAGKASELLYFDMQHRYCGRCGALMEWGSLISKHCTCCGEEIWPKLNTAIIVLVHRGNEALLVKACNFKRDYYGLVAGFVETGESLEECVAREVYEETKLCIGNIRYFGSQPWPYPMGLMIGFHADYESGELILFDGELSDASFFKRDSIPAIPGKMSMARMLIDDWLREK